MYVYLRVYNNVNNSTQGQEELNRNTISGRTITTITLVYTPQQQSQLPPPSFRYFYNPDYNCTMFKYTRIPSNDHHLYFILSFANRRNHFFSPYI